MRYWICQTPGKVEGPIELDTLRSMLASGEVTGSLQVCAEGSETWQSLDSALSEHEIEGAEEGTSKTPPVSRAQAIAHNKKNHSSSLIEGQSYTFSNAFAAGWQGLTQNYGLLLAAAFMVILASLLPSLLTLPINLAGGGNRVSTIALLQIIDFGWALLVVLPLNLGAVWIAVKIARGENAQFSDLWFPFHRLGWVVLGTLLLYLLVLIIYIAGALCGGIPGLILGLIVGSLSGNTEAGVIAGAILGIVIFLPLIFYGLARVFPMMVAIIDPKMGQMNPADAMTWSYKRTGRSISTGQGIAWSLVGLTITLGLIMGASALACGLPYLFFGLPLAAAVVGATYALLSADDINGLLCEHCGYLRHENDSTKCPECGKNWRRTEEAT